MVVVEPLARTDPDSSRRPAIPPTATQAVVRTALVNRLCGLADGALATIVAPAGYGKTTLLYQWAERDRRPVLWIDLEPEDDDAEIVESRLEPVGREPGLLALVDDVQVLRSRPALDALEQVLRHAADGTTMALSSRCPPPFPLARLRAEGRLFELGAAELALTGRETETMLRRTGAALSREDAASLAERLEGWPAALFLAALSLREGTPVASVGGDDRFLADYLHTEHLVALSSSQRRFASETSVLGRLTAESCDSLLERDDSQRLLEALEAAGMVVPLDHRRESFRYPCIVRDLLRADLQRSEPERARALNRAAADRAAATGAIEEALEHAAAAGDLAGVAELADRLAMSACGRGRLDLLEPWLDLLRDDPAVESHPDLCMAAAWLHALRGRAPEAQHWTDAAVRGLGGDDPRLQVLTGLRCRDGADQMLDDANAACRRLPAGHAWRPAAVLTRGTALLLAGDTARAEHDLVEAVEIAAAAGATELRVVGLSLLALLALAESERADAEAFGGEAASVSELEPPSDSLAALLLEAVGARNAARRGELGDAAARLERAGELLPAATYAVPWLSALALLELGHVKLALADADGARALQRGVSDILRVRPRLGVVVQRSAELDRRTRALAEPEGRWATSLTPAERRLLPLLATHLSFREIGERLYVSRNTVKTQAIAVYRKFGVTSRSAAIERAVALGLIDEAAVVPQEGAQSAG